MKNTKQKAMIYNAVMQHRCHPTADYIYHLLKPENPNLSLATVYRNLNTFAGDGRIVKISMPNGSDRFDGTLRPHFHMVCEQCGEVTDIDLSLLEHMAEEVYTQSGFSVSYYNLVIYGVCERCTIGSAENPK